MNSDFSASTVSLNRLTVFKDLQTIPYGSQVYATATSTVAHRAKPTHDLIEAQDQEAQPSVESDESGSCEI